MAADVMGAMGMDTWSGSLILVFCYPDFFSEAVFGAIDEAAEIHAVPPHGEDGDDDGKGE